MDEGLHLFQFPKMATRNCIWTELFMFQSWTAQFLGQLIHMQTKLVSTVSLLVTARKRSLGKVIFSQTSVIPSVHRGVSAFGLGRDVCLWVQEVHTPRTHTHPPGHTPQGQQTGGTHFYWLHFKIKKNKNSLCCIFNNLLV